MSEYSYRNFFQELYRKQGQKYAFHAKTQEEFVLWREAFRSELKERLGLNLLGQEARGFTSEVCLEEEVQEAGYRRRRYVMQTLPQVYMPFYMLIPDGIKPGEKRPAAIAIPAHGANKNTIAGIASCPEEEEKLKRSPKEAYGKSFVQKGYIVFCPDPPGYGERVERVPLEDASFLGNSRRNPLGASCKNLAQTAEALGLSLTGLILWDLQRLLDFACACSQTDTDRITCAGFSGGGQYTMWLAAMDDRIHTAVISGYVHGYYTMMLETHLCPCNYAPDLWRLGDISDICSMIAPRPLFIETGRQDIENGPEGIQNPIEQVSKIRAAYRIFGKEELVEHCIFEGPHMWYGGYFSGIKS